MEIFNLLEAELEDEDRPEGWLLRSAGVGRALGAARIGGSVYELAEGQKSFPYHYHHGVEEWLLVIAGTPTLRTPEGERALAPGDLVCFPAGPAGGHSVLGPGRVLILSANQSPSVVAYPDSDKLGTRTADFRDPDRLNFRRADAVGYWEGEA
jgi:uncharacterized cupin superfamily protein